MKIGIDEAGRGPVIGPLVVCAYATDKDVEAEDSKKLSKNKREEIRERLEKEGIYEILVLDAEELNKMMKTKNLNEIEIDLFIKALKNLVKKHNLKNLEVYIDSCSTNSEKLKEKIKSKIKDIDVKKLVVEHKADEKYKVVSAASIIAKTERDRLIEKLKNKYGDFGSGYPSDPKTIRFLENYYKKYKGFPKIVREKWKTCEKIKAKFSQLKLFGVIR
ncbi:ribonuclease HII [Methanocaldococcus sp.]